MFLGLGTFAVTQTLLRKPSHDPDHSHEVAQGEEQIDVAIPPANLVPATLATKSEPDTNNGFNVSKPPVRNDFQFQNSLSAKPKTEPVNFPKPKGFQIKPDPKSSFESKPPTRLGGIPPVVPRTDLAAKSPATTPVTANRQITPKPAEAPPVVSFGGANPKPKIELPTSSANPFENVAQRGNDFTNDLRGKASSLTNQAVDRGRNAAREAGETLDALVSTPVRPQQTEFGFGQSPAQRTTPEPPRGFQTNPRPAVQAKAAPTTQTPPAASFDPNRSLAPLNSNGLRNQPPVRSATPPARTGFADNGSGARTPSTQQQQLPQLPPRRTPSTIPSRQASTSNPIAPVVSGVLTMPTPGEKELEGTRTPTVSVQRVAPREIQLNTPADFEIIVRNTGRIEANDVRVYDQIPTGTVMLEATPQPTSNNGKSVQWEIGKLAPGQERRILMKLKPTQPGEIGSVAHVTFATRSSMRTLVTKPELTITHSAPARSLIGDNVELDIVVTNNGNGPAKDVVIQEDLPDQLEYPEGFRRIEYPVGVLAPGQSRKLQLSLRAADVGRLRNIVAVSGAGGLSAKHEINMEIVAPKLVANATGPRKRYLRRQATHEFSVQNNGTADATNVEMMAKLPPGLRFVSANNQGQFDPGTNAVYWSLTELAPQSPVSVSMTTVPVDTGTQDIAFTAVADLKQKTTADAPLVVEHLVDVYFEIDDVVDHIEVGSDTSYRMRVVNQGTKTATNVQLFLDLPNGIRPKAVEGGLQGQVQGQRVVFAPITSMNPGDEINVSVSATGVAPGEHKVVAQMRTDDRQTNISKEETTQVYSDR